MIPPNGPEVLPCVSGQEAHLLGASGCSALGTCASSAEQGWSQARLAERVSGGNDRWLQRVKQETQPSRCIWSAQTDVLLAHVCLMLKLPRWAGFRWFTLEEGGCNVLCSFLLSRPHANSN